MANPRFLVYFLLLSIIPLHGQQDSCAIKLQSVYGNYGMSFYAVPELDLQTQQHIAEGSVLMSQNYGSASDHLSGSEEFGVYHFSAGTEFNKYNRKKNEYGKFFSFGAGLTYQPFSPGAFGSLVKTNGGRSDTTYSTVYDGMGNPHPDTTVHDTLSHYFRSFEWRQSIFSIDLHASFHTDENKLLCMGVGLGIQAGYGFFGNARINTSMSSWTFDSSIVTHSHGLHPAGDEVTLGSEKIKTKPSFLMCGNMLFFLQIRFPEKWNLLNRFALTIELHPGLYIMTIPGEHAQNFFQSGASAGLKFYLE